MNLKLWDGSVRCDKHMDASSYESLTNEACSYCPSVQETVCEAPAEEPERIAYRAYIEEGLASTDGWFSPVSFELFTGRLSAPQRAGCHCGAEAAWNTSAGPVCRSHKPRRRIR